MDARVRPLQNPLTRVSLLISLVLGHSGGLMPEDCIIEGGVLGGQDCKRSCPPDVLDATAWFHDIGGAEW